MRVLANDGIAADGKRLLEEAGFEVVTEKVEQADLKSALDNYDVLVVRSATKVKAADLPAGSRLKLIVRAGVGIDNIEVPAAEAKGITVRNTPNSSSLSVAELAIAHMFAIARFLHESNQNMPSRGATDFKDLKKKYEKGFELRGKKLGIIGFGRIGQETAKIAIGVGMEVSAFTRNEKTVELVFDHLPFQPTPRMNVTTQTELIPFLKDCDIISLHIPGGQNGALLGGKEINAMKDGVIIINTARGGVVDEKALTDAICSGKVAFAGVDVFVNEPSIDDAFCKGKNLSLTPHIGAATKEAQTRVSHEVAQVIIETMK